jgi:hypothetical protein
LLCGFSELRGFLGQALFKGLGLLETAARQRFAFLGRAGAQSAFSSQMEATVRL